MNKITKTIGGHMSSTRDNTYTNTNKRTFYLSDYVDNESIGKLMLFSIVKHQFIHIVQGML